MPDGSLQLPAVDWLDRQKSSCGISLRERKKKKEIFEKEKFPAVEWMGGLRWSKQVGERLVWRGRRRQVLGVMEEPSEALVSPSFRHFWRLFTGDKSLESLSQAPNRA